MATRIAATLLLALGLSLPAQAKEPTSWLGIGYALGTAHVKHPTGVGINRSVDSESGFISALTVNLSVVGDLAFKLRYTGAQVLFEGEADDSPSEFGAMIGLPFNAKNPRRGPVLYAGFGRVFHADDSLDQPINGLAAEFSFLRWGGSGVGGEMGIQGFYVDKGDEEVDYIAFNIGMRFGNL